MKQYRPEAKGAVQDALATSIGQASCFLASLIFSIFVPRLLDLGTELRVLGIPIDADLGDIEMPLFYLGVGGVKRSKLRGALLLGEGRFLGLGSARGIEKEQDERRSREERSRKQRASSR